MISITALLTIKEVQSKIMGIRFRRSINLGGGFRVNISKTGIGYSWGVPGARISKTAAGRNRTTLSIPGTGLSYVKESGSTKRKNTSASRSSPVARNNTYSRDHNVPIKTIENADVDAYAPAEYKDFLEAIQRFFSINTLSLAASVILLIITAILGAPGIVIFILALILFGFILWIRNKYRVNAYYEQGEFCAKRIQLVDALMQIMQNNHKIWQVNEAYKAHARTSAGAGISESLTPVAILAKAPPFLKTNVQCYSIKLKHEHLYILPDKLIIVKGLRPGAIDLTDLIINVSSVRHVTHNVPGDAEVVGHSWKYVNKNGSPDKRYKDNYQLAICKYGEISIKSDHGFNTVLYTSNIDNANKFSSIYKKC